MANRSKTWPGELFPGMHRLSSKELYPTQVSALGNGWRQLLKGTFPTAAYDAATEIATVLNRAAARDGLPGGEMLTFPTIDVYSPTPVQARRVAAVQPETFVRTLPPPRSARALRVRGDFFSM